MSNAVTYQIGIGDPTFFSWVIVFAYLITSWFCFKKARQLRENTSSLLFWGGLSFLLLILGINKELDLQTLFGQLARESSILNGWYADRKLVQYAFVVLLASILIFSLVFARLLLLEAWQRFKLAWLGIAVLFVFVFLRAAHFNHQFKSLIDHISGYYQYLELVGILLILCASYLKIQKSNT